MKKILLLIVLFVSAISLTACSRIELSKEEVAQNKYEQVKYHIQDEFDDYQITGAFCYELTGSYLYVISLERTVNSNYSEYYKTTYLLIDENGNMSCLTCGDSRLSDLYFEYRDTGTYIPIDLDYIPDNLPEDTDKNWFENIELPDFLQEIIDWIEGLF